MILKPCGVKFCVFSHAGDIVVVHEDVDCNRSGLEGFQGKRGRREGRGRGGQPEQLRMVGQGQGAKVSARGKNAWKGFWCPLGPM